jgi:BMFP domain-containing protein YqiC
MQTQNRLLDDLARVATGALGAFTGMRDEIETRMKEQFERVLGRMNLVTREEYDAVKAMAAKARSAQEALEKRVAALEAKLGQAKSGGSRGNAPAASKSPPAPVRKIASRGARPRRSDGKSR